MMDGGLGLKSEALMVRFPFTRVELAALLPC